MVSEAGRCQVLINSAEPMTIMDRLAKDILDLRVDIKPLAPELIACIDYAEDWNLNWGCIRANTFILLGCFNNHIHDKTR